MLKLKLKKINLDQAKEFLFNHGEKVALGTCGFLALFMGAMGLLNAMSAGKDEKGKSWVAELKGKKDLINTSMSQVQPAPLDEALKNQLTPDPYRWDPKDSNFDWLPPAMTSDDPNSSTKRRNPLPLTIKSGPDYIKLDYVRALDFHFAYAPNKASVLGLLLDGAPGGKTTYMLQGQPQRMVVCTAVFPMKEQVEEFRIKLRMKHKELYDSRDDMPKPAGINVLRYEVLPSNKLSQPETLVFYDPTKGLDMSEGLKKLLGSAMYDDSVPTLMEPYAFNGLLMPTPKLAYGTYPNVTLGVKKDRIELALETLAPALNPGGTGKKNTGTGFIVDKGKGKTPPKKEEPAGNLKAYDTFPITETELEKVEKGLAERLFKGKFNVFHAMGIEPPQNLPFQKGVAPPPVQPGSMRFFSAFDLPRPALDPAAGGGAGQPLTPAEDAKYKWDRDALVRFIDPDVKPGKTYRYAVQVRIKNPNFGKADLVAANKLSEIEELPLEATSWVYTPDITIDEDYFLYNVDQHALDVAAGKADKFLAAETKKDHYNYTPFQVHKWIAKGTEAANLQNDYIIGDWVIAERQGVRRGDIIGLNADVRVPVWKERENAFEVPLKKDPKDKSFKGIRMNLNTARELPLLVDFFGGKRKIDKGEEESSVEALVLSPEGKLIVLNSREDAAFEGRQTRVLHSRKRVEDALNGANAAASK